MTVRMVEIAKDAVRSAIEHKLSSRGFGQREIGAIVEPSVRATLDGHVPHGIGALFISDEYGELIPAEAEPHVTMISPTYLNVDAGQSLGYWAAQTAVDRIVKQSDDAKCPMPVLANVSSRGYRSRLGYLLEDIAERGFAAIAWQSTPFAVTYSGTESLGTNPVAIAVPRKDGKRPIVSDMCLATCSFAECWWNRRFPTELSEKEPNKPHSIGGHRGALLSATIQLLASALCGVPIDCANHRWGLSIMAMPVRDLKMSERSNIAEWFREIGFDHIPGEGARKHREEHPEGTVMLPEELVEWLAELG